MRHLQDKVENFCEQHNLSKSVEARFLDVVSELGELAKEILLNSNYGKKTIENSERLEEEIGDTIFSLIALSKFLLSGKEFENSVWINLYSSNK